MTGNTFTSASIYGYAVLIFIVSTATERHMISCKGCNWSQLSLTTATSCPQNENEQQRRAETKNCESLALKQNCTDPAKFKYHCVPDELQSTFVEVCAQEIFIAGFCTEYNTYGMVIQASHHSKCKEVDPPCPSRYLSTDAYKYQGCYNGVKKRNSRSSESSIDTPGKIDNNQEPRSILCLVILLSHIVTTVVLGGLILFKKQLWKCIKQLLQPKVSQKKRSEEELSNDRTLLESNEPPESNVCA